MKSYAGSSTELPFTIHVGIAGPFDALDGLEPDTIHDPVGFDLPPVGYYRRISRTLYTRADNDWYVFDVPAASKIIGIQLENSPGHTTEIYTFADGQARRVGFTSAGVASSRKYYIRVINQKGTSLSGTNYQLDVTPREPVSPPPPQRTELGEFIIENTPMYVTNPKAPDVNYKLGRTKWKCRGTLEFDMKESFPLDTCLLLYFPADHRNDMTGTEEIRIQYKKKFSVPLDYLYLSEYVYVSIWNDHWHDTDFTLAGSITSYA